MRPAPKARFSYHCTNFTLSTLIENARSVVVLCVANRVFFPSFPTANFSFCDTIFKVLYFEKIN